MLEGGGEKGQEREERKTPASPCRRGKEVREKRLRTDLILCENRLPLLDGKKRGRGAVLAERRGPWAEIEVTKSNPGHIKRMTQASMCTIIESTKRMTIRT